jgi:hypothetical protein
MGPENRDCLVPGMATRETNVHKITNIQYLFFYMALGLNDLMGADPLLGPLEGVGLEKRDIWGSGMATRETHVHKITNVHYFFLYGTWI